MPLTRGFSSGLRRVTRGDITGVVGHHDLHPAVQLSTHGVLVAGDRVFFAVTLRSHMRRIRNQFNDCATNRFGTSFRKLIVVWSAAGAVGESFDQYIALRVLLKKLGNLLYIAYAAGFQLRHVGIEQYVPAQSDDDTTRRKQREKHQELGGELVCTGSGVLRLAL